MRSTLIPILAGAVGLSLAACAASSHREDQVGSALAEPVVVEVRNQNFYDATVWAVTGARRDRLGFVPSNSHATFRYTWVHPEVQLEIALQSVGSYRTERISVSAGETLQYTIPPDAHRLLGR